MLLILVNPGKKDPITRPEHQTHSQEHLGHIQSLAFRHVQLIAHPADPTSELNRLNIFHFRIEKPIRLQNPDPKIDNIKCILHKDYS